MKPEINELIEISKYYGSNKEYVIAGGGNTSFKDEQTIWIKASGQSLAELTEDGLVALSREKLHVISSGIYSDDPSTREEQVKADMFHSILDPGKNKRPSVETSLHEIIQYKFIHSAGAASAGTWESIDNRTSWIVDGDQTISKFWEDKDPNVTLADGNIFFEVNMSVATEIGVFNPNVDSVQIRGAFNGWNDSQPEKSHLNQDPGNPNAWYLNIPLVKQVLNDSLLYKFFIKIKLILLNKQ